MRKQTKLVAVLSAAALLAIGASMTSFAAWQKSDDGTWQYYDRDDEMVTGEWQKDGSKWFYLDDDGNMLNDSWVDDEYYVGDDGAMIVNNWKKTLADADMDDPDDDGESWYYFGSKGKKTTAEDKKIGGKTYYFDEDGKMRDGWYQADADSIYYLGDEDDGARTSGWLWLETPDADDDIANHGDDNDDACDEEGWYNFGSNGKMNKGIEKKKINGKYYFFNEHGQMLYEWINNAKTKVTSSPTNAELDGNIATPNNLQADNMLYMNQVEEGWRADGWYEIDGSEDTDSENDTDWYYFKDGAAKKASMVSDGVTYDEDGEVVFRSRIKVLGKYFCFNELGQMQTGLQYDDGFYFYDDNGYMKTGKVTTVEEDDDDFTYYFNAKNGKNGLGVTGEKDGYLYFNGKRLEADDDYRLYAVAGEVYLVNSKGKIQKSTSMKKYDIENEAISKEDVEVTFSGKQVATVGDVTAEKLLSELSPKLNGRFDNTGKVSVPEITLYDDVYTYTRDEDNKLVVENWLSIQNPEND